MTETPPDCEVGGCEHNAHYLLTSGDLCTEHALEDEPANVKRMRTIAGVPEAAENDSTWGNND